MTCRNTERAEEARREILSIYGEGQPTSLKTNIVNEEIKEFITPLKPDHLIIEDLNLGSFKSLRVFVERRQPCHSPAPTLPSVLFSPSPLLLGRFPLVAYSIRLGPRTSLCSAFWNSYLGLLAASRELLLQPQPGSSSVNISGIL
ncbi:unnamed protein product [Hymenolepis diminuta]|uniref:Uncharacterized protein n=1 Tax=Hymenolepis diminuta TaxID=6216 RepID=A0A564Z6C2_HYMDI|nr:unnamed protein product [Hymenolepis diminuta]